MKIPFLNEKTSVVIKAASRNPLSFYALIVIVAGVCLLTKFKSADLYWATLAIFLILAALAFILHRKKPMPTPHSIPKPSPALVIQEPFSVGDQVLIVRGEKEIFSEEHGVTTWTSKMNKFVGRTAILTSVDLESETCKIEEDQGKFDWHFTWLRKIKRSEVT